MGISKETAKAKLADLIKKYNSTLRLQDHSDISEETVRTWLNSFLYIFGWDVKDVSQVRQEKKLKGASLNRLNEINSTYTKPDYALINGNNIKAFVDAKNLDVDIFNDSDVAFQIRSYGWSAQTPCSFVSNFEQFVIYDTRFVPSNTQPANYGVKQFIVDEYLDNFDELYEHLNHDYICSNHLEELYETTAIEGNNRLDDSFMEMLSSFRLSLAQNLFDNNQDVINTNERLNYYTQVILDRIVFIRVCESKGIEQQEKLRSFITSNTGFWNSFKNSCYMEFYSHYDGALFDRDAIFQRLNLDDDCFEEFIQDLYYPAPYRFDVIPVKVIANIYEVFLGKQLAIINGNILEITKDEYVKTQGAIATPEHIVDMVCKQTLRLENIKNIGDLFNIKILDACCGSGIFIVSCYELLCNKAISIFRDNAKDRTEYSELFCEENQEVYLTIVGRRELVRHCLYSIDCDLAAIEVTKMSLALKIVDGDNPLIWKNLGAYGGRILQDIADNVVLGNSLVSTPVDFTPEQIEQIKPLNIQQVFSSVFEQGGFDYVIGNPPYVETKHYKAALPEMHMYLKERYSSFSGKADLAVLFIERGLELLNERGRLGFIIQQRWFKTNYGNLLSSSVVSLCHSLYLLSCGSVCVFPEPQSFSKDLFQNTGSKTVPLMSCKASFLMIQLSQP